VNKGLIPREIEKSNRDTKLDIHLKDRQSEEYVAPKPVVKPFTGSGQALGSTSSQTTTTTAASSSNPLPNAPSKQLSLDSSKPVTSLQLRLHDGTRLVGKFNLDHTVQDIQNFVLSAQKLPPGKTCQLMTTFPKQILSNLSLTISDAKLQNAVIVQTLV